MKFLICLPSFFFSIKLNSKTIWWMQILNTQIDCFANRDHSYTCLKLCVSHVFRVMASKLFQKHVLICIVPDFSRNDFVGVACIVRPHLDYWTCALLAATSLLGTTPVCISRSLFIVFAINFVYLMTISSSRECHCIYMFCPNQEPCLVPEPVGPG